MRNFKEHYERSKVDEIRYIMEAVSDSLRKEVLDLVKKVESDQDLIRVKNTLMAKAISEEIEKFRQKSFLDDKEVSYIEKLIVASNASVESKFELIALLKGKSSKLSSKDFGKTFTKSLNSLTPKKFLNNQCWKSITQDILNYSQQSANGVGKAELYFMLIGKNGSKPSSRGKGAKGDVVIDGFHIEMKAGGVMHTGHRDGVKMGITIEIHAELIEWGKKNGYDMSNANPIYGSFHQVSGAKQNWLWMFFDSLPKKDYDRLMKKYLSKVYGKAFSAATITALANKLRPILGDKEKVPALFAPYVYMAYKKHEKFNSLMVVDLRSNVCYNMVDKKIPSGLKFKGPQMARGKSTYAVPEGGISFGFDRSLKEENDFEGDNTLLDF